MKSMKKTLLLSIFAVLILIILIITILLGQNNKKSTDTSPDIISTSELDNLEVSLVKNESEYHDIERIINTYFTYINYLDYNYFQVELNDDEKNKEKEKYFEKGKQALQNILLKECTEDEKWEDKLLKYTSKETNIVEMNKISYSKMSVYLLNINNGEENNNIIIFVDNENETFSMLPSDYIDTQISKEDLSNTVKEKNIQKVEENEDNKFKKIELSEENICIQYYYDYLDKLRNNTDKLFEVLDKTYRERRFENIEKFKEYITNNKEQLEKAVLSKYQVKERDNYTEYICLDEEGRYYIFNATAAMEYTLFLDTYTVDLPQFVEEYNKASVQGKVVLNINKVITALNAQDYKYIYSKLADSFKKNYYQDEEVLKEFLVNNLYENNTVEFGEFAQEGTLYTYKIKVTKIISEDEADLYYGKNAPYKNLNIVMQLNEGTDFIMSFSIE